MKDLYIIGAGGFGREVAWLVERINDVSFEWYVVFSLFHLFDGIYMYNLYLSIWDLQY